MARRGRQGDEIRPIIEVRAGGNIIFPAAAAGNYDTQFNGLASTPPDKFSTHDAITETTVGAYKTLVFTAPRSAYYEIMLFTHTEFQANYGIILGYSVAGSPRSFYPNVLPYVTGTANASCYAGARLVYLEAGEQARLISQYVLNVVADVNSGPFYLKITSITDSRRTSSY